MTFGHHLSGIALLLLVALGPAPLCLALVTRARVGRGTTLDTHSLLLLLTCWCVCGAGLAIALGATGRLTAGWVFGAESAMLIAGVLVLLSMRRRGELRGLLGSRLLEEPAGVAGSVVLAALAGLAAVLLWQVAARPIVENDSLAYHLPAIAEWYQSGYLRMPAQYMSVARYPYAWEALCVLHVFPFGEDFAVAFPNVIAWGLYGMAAYQLARLARADQSWGLAAAAIVMTLPSVLGNVNTMHVDMPFAAFALVSLYLGIASARTPYRGHLGFFLATLGMLLGIKMSGLAYAAVALLASAMAGLALRGKRVASREVGTGVAAAAVGLCFLLLVGGFWYIRNVVEVGNPLGYVRVQIGDVVLLPGQYDLEHFRRTTILHIFDVTNADDWRTLMEQMRSKLGLPLGVLVGLAMLAAPGLARRGRRASNGWLVSLGALVLVTCFLYATTPYTGDTGVNQWQVSPFIGQAFRFAFPCLGVLAALAAAGASARRLPPAVGAGAALLCTAVALQRAGMVWVLLLALAALASITALARLTSTRRTPWASLRWVTAASIIALMALLAVGSFGVRKLRHRARSAVYGPVFSHLEREIAPSEPVAYLMSNQRYVLYGRELRRRVIYAELEGKSGAEWAEWLRRQGVGLVAAGPVPDGGGEELGALREMAKPDGLLAKEVDGDPTKEMVLYRVGNSGDTIRNY